jgi:cold shock CspA family protein
MSERVRGTVRRYGRDFAYGFLAAGADRDIYFTTAAAIRSGLDPDELWPGDEVEFEIRRRADGKLFAHNLRLLESAGRTA